MAPGRAQALAYFDNLSFENLQPNFGDCKKEILQSLRARQKQLSPKFFYDQRGSELFEEITRQPEYYPTRTEISILKDNAQAISEQVGRHALLIEPGSGNSEKVRYLINDLEPSAYVAMDISEDFLLSSAMQLAQEYPWLQVHGVCADFNQTWQPPEYLQQDRRVVFYPGSTLGNLEPTQALNFLVRKRNLVGSNGGLLIGVDQHKSQDILNAAYNDANKVTEAFNLNALDCVNELLAGDFDVNNFRHKAFYNTQHQRIEMHLECLVNHRVNLDNQRITFKAGETIHTENSYKYTPEQFAQLAQQAGFSLVKRWSDSDDLFSVYYLSASE